MPDAATRTNPNIEFIIRAFDDPIHSDTAPIINDPIGPAPIAIVTTPKALPLNSGFETNNTIVDCIVPNPDVPIPKNKSSDNDKK